MRKLYLCHVLKKYLSALNVFLLLLRIRAWLELGNICRFKGYMVMTCACDCLRLIIITIHWICMIFIIILYFEYACPVIAEANLSLSFHNIYEYKYSLFLG